MDKLFQNNRYEDANDGNRRTSKTQVKNVHMEILEEAKDKV